MSKITEEMVVENTKCKLYADFFKEFETSERNLKSDFLDSVRCTGIFVPKPWEIAKEYREKAQAAGLDSAWIDKFIPADLEDKEGY